MAKPVGFEGANCVIQAPEGVPSEECCDLECFTAPGRIISCWRLSPEELNQITETGVVWLEVQGDRTPPVVVSGKALMTVGDRPARAEPVMPRAPRKATDSDKGPPEPQSA